MIKLFQYFDMPQNKLYIFADLLSLEVKINIEYKALCRSIKITYVQII